MEGVVNVEWHGQDYLHLKWHVVCSGLATPGIEQQQRWTCSWCTTPSKHLAKGDK